MILNSTQLEQDSVAVATGRHVLMSEGQGSCDVMEALGREVVVSYLSTLQELELRPLVTELRILKTKAEVSRGLVKTCHNLINCKIHSKAKQDSL